jgi:hypothetical protein
MANHPLSPANAWLAKALKKIGHDPFAKRLVLLGWANGQRTNKHVERNPRGLRMRQKTRSKRRQPHTLAQALAWER